MSSYIPHQKNPHSWRTALFVVLIIGVSAVSAYFAQKYLQPINASALADNVVKVEQPAVLVEKEEVLPVIDDVVDQSDADVKDEPKEIELPAIERNKNPATKLEEAKKYSKPQIEIGKYIDISLRYQNMVIFEDGKVLDAYQISSGKKGMDTPIGTFKIENKFPKAWSKAYGLWMPNWMAILPTGKVGIHELPVWPSGYQEGAAHLGIPVSHGCVRLGPGAAKRVYDWAEVGTPVIVHK
jgi:lipoprotein-anchoring transpeptidase ErfK/SrfK